MDEAHCIKSWGSGKIPFRKEYGRLATFRLFVPKSVPFVALTQRALDWLSKRHLSCRHSLLEYVCKQVTW